MTKPTIKKKVLFVCMGNICRSPAAEGVFRHMVAQAGLDEHFHIDSAGTGAWHAGEPPDARMTEHARRRGYDLSQLLARQFNPSLDFERFDLILTMDKNNFKNILNLDVKKQFAAKVKPVVFYCKIHQIEEVPDPYYEEEEGFEHVLDLLEDACSELLKKLREGQE